MAETTTATVPASPPKSPKKRMTAGKKKTGSKAPANHPPYQSMIKNAIKTMKEMKGSSRQAILKFLMANYQVGGDAIKINAHLKMALKRMVKSNDLKQLKGTGASGRFRLDKAKKTEGKPRKRTVKKTGKAKKSRKPKMMTTTAATTGEAPAASPAKKSTKKPKSPKKVTKKTTKPKKARSPAKKTGAKKSPKKKMAKKSSPKKMKKTTKAPAVATA